MSEKQEDGETMEVHLKNLIKSPFASIEQIEEARLALISPPLPPVGQYLIGLFHKAQARRPNTGMGISPIDFREFYGKRGIHLVGWEADILESLDTLVITRLNIKTQKDADRIRAGDTALPSSNHASVEPRSPYA